MHLAAPEPDGEGMSQFVQELYERKGKPQEQQIFGGQKPVGRARRQFRPVQGGKDKGRDHDHQPQQNPCPPGERFDQRQSPDQQAIGIDQRETQGERVHETPLPPARPPLLPPGQFQNIRHDIGDEDISLVQPGEQPDDLVLRNHIVAEEARRLVPDFPHRPPAVHQADYNVGGPVEAVLAVGGPVLQDVPDRAAVGVSADPDMATQGGPDFGDPVPVGAVQLRGGNVGRGFHGGISATA